MEFGKIVRVKRAGKDQYRVFTNRGIDVYLMVIIMNRSEFIKGAAK